MRAPRTGRPLGGPIIIRLTPEPKPTADIFKQRPHLSPGVDTSYATAENLDAQQDWQSRFGIAQDRRIDAGLIKVTR